jgi:hypothetical protein
MRPHRVTLAVALAALLMPAIVGAPAVAAIGPIVIDDAEADLILP